MPANKITYMKKFLSVLVIAASLTACGGSGDTAAAKTDSVTTTVADSTKQTVDSTINAVADTAKAKISAVADSAKKLVK